MASLLTDNLGACLVSEKWVNVLTPSIPSDPKWIWSKMFVKQDVIRKCRTVVFKGWELLAENNLHGWDKNIACTIQLFTH